MINIFSKIKGGQIAIGWIISGGIFLASVVFGAGSLAMKVTSVSSAQEEQKDINQQLTKIQTDILVIIGKQDERLKFLENNKGIK